MPDRTPQTLTILHLDTERGWRGGERQALWLARSLAAAGHRSIVVARPGELLAARALEHGIPVIPCAPLAEFDLVAALKLRTSVRRADAQIVHAHSAHAVALGALATAGTRARLVVTRRVDFRLRTNVWSRWKYSRADAIIAISQAVARALVESGLPRERIDVIPSGIDLTRTFTRATSDTLSALGVPPAAPLVVQVSQLVPHKDPVTFINAIAAARQRVPSLHALLVGDGPLRREVEGAVEKHGLRHVVHLTGYRSDADSLLAAADVATHSSKEEGLGTVLLDAMSLGKPVAATAGGGIPEVVEDNVSGLISPVGDGESLGINIAALLLDRALAWRVSEAARIRASEFSMERTTERTMGVYLRALDS